MKYTDPELIEYLASDYVLGTMRGKARQRFERLQMQSYKVRQVVWEWEKRLYPISEGIEDVDPPGELWTKIQQRIHPEDTLNVDTGFWRSLAVWRTWGALTTATAIALLVLTLNTGRFESPVISEDYMAVFNNTEAEPLWIVRSDMQTGELSIRAVNIAAQAVDKAFELWMLPEDGTNPRSLGLLPVAGDKQQYSIPPALVEILRTSKGLAVSVEPIGGSPTGLPTGPVLYQASLIEL